VNEPRLSLFGVPGAEPIAANPPAEVTLNVEFVYVRPASVALGVGVQANPKHPLVEPANVVSTASAAPEPNASKPPVAAASAARRRWIPAATGRKRFIDNSLREEKADGI
jgi:hypothetical protein